MSNDKDDVLAELQEQDVSELVMWKNPDIPSFEDVLESPDHEIEVTCPGDGCTADHVMDVPGTVEPNDDGEITVSAVKDEFLRMVQEDGTMRCYKCDEPWIGARGYRTGGMEL